MHRHSKSFSQICARMARNGNPCVRTREETSPLRHLEGARYVKTVSEPQEELCVATTKDRQNVIDSFGDVYHGADSLSSLFPQLVEGPGVKAFLYKVKGELVAFCSTKLQDGGHTLLTSAARVKVTHQGQGISGRFRRKVFQEFADVELYPRLQCEVMTTDSANSYESKRGLQKNGWTFIMNRDNTMAVFESASLSRLTIPPAGHQVSTLTAQSFRQLLQGSPSSWSHLFPQERIIVMWKPFRVMVENLDSILDDSVNTQMFVTTPSPSLQYSMLSIGTYHPCDLGISYTLDIYGTADEDEITDHINAHLRRLKEVLTEALTGTVVFNIFYTETLDKVVAEATKELQVFTLDGLSRISKGVCLWEREITGI